MVIFFFLTFKGDDFIYHQLITKTNFNYILHIFYAYPYVKQKHILQYFDK